ncbi:class IV adenylate cyclase [Streptomyces sp. NPDC052107]|uniref:class IV adenylate cyclase n=1 Tax=Streptomyces sp. NPDC052107 TaxID=3155632 RepID=UPI00341F1AB3
MLSDLGWTAAEPVLEVDTYYSRPDVDFMQTVECLRVRQREDFAEITYKPASTTTTHSANSVISKPETNVHLASAAQAALADRLLESIGMRLLVRVEKNRTAYRLPRHPDVTISIDTLADAGVFVETEAISEDAEAAAHTVEQIEKQLDIVDAPAVELPYRDLALRRKSGALKV